MCKYLDRIDDALLKYPGLLSRFVVSRMKSSVYSHDGDQICAPRKLSKPISHRFFLPLSL